MRLKDIMVQVARTALLCGTLGIALYLAISYAARFPAFAPGLAFVGSLALAWLTVSTIRYSLQNRLIPMKPRSIFRDEQPILYWGFLGFEIACGAAMIAIMILSGLRLMEGIDGGTPLDAG